MKLTRLLKFRQTSLLSLCSSVGRGPGRPAGLPIYGTSRVSTSDQLPCVPGDSTTYCANESRLLGLPKRMEPLWVHPTQGLACGPSYSAKTELFSHHKSAQLPDIPNLPLSEVVQRYTAVMPSSTLGPGLSCTPGGLQTSGPTPLAQWDMPGVGDARGDSVDDPMARIPISQGPQAPQVDKDNPLPQRPGKMDPRGLPVVKKAKRIMKIRRRRMNKLRRDKWRKRDRELLFRRRHKKEVRKRKAHEAVLESIRREGQEFDAEQYVMEQLERARRGGYSVNVWDGGRGGAGTA